MREILFRGRTKGGKWCYGDYVHAIRFNGVHGFHKDWIIPGVYGNGGWISMRGKHAVDGDTVGQYTGLTDKNGVKIFENGYMIIDNKTYKVIFDNAEYILANIFNCDIITLKNNSIKGVFVNEI